VNRRLDEYSTLIFDCDGVLLDSNKIKTNVFYLSALLYGENNAKKFVDYHLKNGGVSRYEKYQFFLEKIIGTEVNDIELGSLLNKYASEVREGLLTCSVAEGLGQLRKQSSIDWMIVSGGDQNELRDIFHFRGLAGFFNKGIYGSPDTKSMIFEHQRKKGNLKGRALYVGDSMYDYVAAKQAGIDFIFISGWSEFTGWQEYTKANSIPVLDDVCSLLYL